MSDEQTEPEPEPSDEPVRAGGLARIDGLASRAERRIRIGRSLAWGASAACASLASAVVTLALRKTDALSERHARIAFVVEGALTLAAALFAYLRPLPLRAGAVALDRHHGLADRLSSAISFGLLPKTARTPFMDAAIDDALSLVKTVSPAKAVPIRAPRDLVAVGGLAVALVAVALFEVRQHTILAQKTIDAVEVTPDDLDAMREFLKQQEQTQQSDEAKLATQEFNQLIEDLSAKRLDRTEAFRRMQALDDKLMEGSPADKKALEDALQKIGEEMKKAEMTKPAGEALDQKNLVDADKQLKDLAKKLRESGSKPDKQQLDKMREALKTASEDAEKRKADLEKKRDELKKEIDLLKQKQQQAQQDGGAPNDQEKNLLDKKERELEKLEQDAQAAGNASRQLSKLDQDLQQAAEDLMKDLGASANDLDQGAEDINRMAEQQMTDQEKEQLRQKLQELKEMLRQQGQGGQQQMVRLVKFQQRAHGQGGDPQQGQGQQGQGQDGQGQQGQGQQGQGQQGQGQQGQGQGQGQQGQGGQGAGQGQGQGGGSQETWIVGPNGEKILMISQGQGQGQGQGQNGGGGGQPGKGWGTGHDGNVQGKATNPNMGTQDTQVAGQDTGQGQSRSQVIEGAAERGFSNRGYTKVYREYHTVAEEALNKDEIPGGYRFYVRRYFQLIRPRDGQ